MKFIAVTLLVLISFTSHTEELTEYNRIQNFSKKTASLIGGCEDYAFLVSKVIGVYRWYLH